MHEKKQPRGYISFVLHAHLPFVRHPEHERSLEEVWLFEALTECYLPLLNMFQRLTDAQVPFRIGVSLSPPLLQMLADKTMQARYEAHLERLISLAQAECRRLKREPVYLDLAEKYCIQFKNTLERFRNVYGRDIIGAFSAAEASGCIELMTTAATHGYLPLFQHQEGAINAQIKAGVETFKRFFHKVPESFWLPECGYYPELEKWLVKEGICNTFLDTHGVTGATPLPRQSCYAPICSGGMVFYPRDPEASRQVWSSTEGYPGDYDYREYHSDIGFTLPLEYLKGYLLADGTRVSSGIKYHRVSGPNLEKEPYDAEQAQSKAEAHARHFVKSRLQRLSEGPHGDCPLLMVAPYDAELFGHWWHEGPYFLECVLREIAQQPLLETIAPKDYTLRFGGKIQHARPVASSWGQAGHNRFWINEDTMWIFPLLHQAYTRYVALIEDNRDDGDGVKNRALKQVGRTLLLAQSSDWPFIIRAGTTTKYAIRRIQEELSRFRFLEEAIRSGRIDKRKLAALEIMDDMFPEIDFLWFLK